MKGIGKWAMIDVFCCGFFIFCTVSDQLVPGTKRLNGAFAMVVFSVLSYALDIVT